MSLKYSGLTSFAISFQRRFCYEKTETLRTASAKVIANNAKIEKEVT